MSRLRYFDQVRYGSFSELEVLVDPDTRELWVAQISMAKMLGWGELDSTGVRQKLKAKSLKVFSGKTLTGVKSIEGFDSLGRRNKYNAIPFDSFVTVTYWQLQEGNEHAKRLLLAGFVDSFSSLVLAQCGIKVTEDERQQIVSFYLTEYHEFFDWIRDRYQQIFGTKPASDYYREINITLNQHLFGFDHFKCDRKSNADNKQLRRLENYQMMIMERVDKYPNLEPLTCVQTILQTM